MKDIRNGFTLIELLLVITIISILMVVVFAALNPAVRLRDSRNSRRWSDVNELLTAVHECLIDNNGLSSSCGLTDDGSERQIGTCTSGGASNCPLADAACENDIDAAPMTSYIAYPPVDPTGSVSTTGYSIKINSGIVTVSSCLAEGQTISVSR